MATVTCPHCGQAHSVSMMTVTPMRPGSPYKRRAVWCDQARTTYFVDDDATTSEAQTDAE